LFSKTFLTSNPSRQIVNITLLSRDIEDE